MGELERFIKQYNGSTNAASLDSKRRVEEIKREMLTCWDRYKRSMNDLHGVKIEDNGLEKIILYLVMKGVL